MKMVNHHVLLVLSLLVSLVRGGTYEKDECDACAFDSHDPEDCKLYGQLHSNELIAWSKATQECLDFYKINEESFPHSVVTDIWPKGPGSGNIQKLVAFLKDPELQDNKQVKFLKRGTFYHFFVEEGDGGPVVFKDRVSVGETWFDCTENKGEDCWTAVRDYLAYTEEGERAMSYAYIALLDGMRQDHGHEQQEVRIELCHNHVNAALSSICGSLYTQISEQMRKHPSLDCSAFGLGPGDLKVVNTNCQLDKAGASMNIHDPSKAAGSPSAATGSHKSAAAGSRVPSALGLVAAMALCAFVQTTGTVGFLI